MVQKKRRERITDAERKEALKEASKFVLDIAKLLFAGVILSTIMDLDMNKMSVILAGGIILILLILFGIYLYYIAIKRF